MNNTHNECKMYLVCCKVINATEYKKKEQVKGAGQCVVFSRVLRKVCLCIYVASRGGGESANEKEVIWTQEPSTGAGFGLRRSFMAGKSGQVRNGLPSPNMYRTHILLLLQPLTLYLSCSKCLKASLYCASQ